MCTLAETVMEVDVKVAWLGHHSVNDDEVHEASCRRSQHHRLFSDLHQLEFDVCGWRWPIGTFIRK